MVTELYSKLSKLNIQLHIVAGKLQLHAPKGVLTNELLAEVKTHKQALIALINSYQSREHTTSLIPPAAIQDSYPLSSSQRRLWLLSQFESSTAYYIPGVFAFEGNLDFAALSYAFAQLVTRHEILRTCFREDATGIARQYIKEAGTTGFTLFYEDLRQEPDRNASTKARVQAVTTQEFDLAQGPLLRAGIYQLADESCLFVYVVHHIISDGWSMGILIRELLQLYSTHQQRRPSLLHPLRIQYKDYATWQQAQLKQNALSTHKAYWLAQMEGPLPVLDLPMANVRPPVKTYCGGTVSRKLGTGLTKGLQALVREQGATLFMGLLSTVTALLYRYTGQLDLIVGSPIAGREHQDLEDQLGFYVNTLALRMRLKEEDSFQELLDRTKEVTLAAYEHQLYPLDELLNDLHLRHDPSRSALFDVMVVLQNNDSQQQNEQWKLGDLLVTPHPMEEQQTSKFDLTFNFWEAGEDIEAVLEYNSDLLALPAVERLADHLVQLLAAILAEPLAPVARLDYLSESERHQLLVAFNDTQTSYPAHQSVVQLFEAQVEKTPHALALAFGATTLTYQQLNEQANQLAHYLVEQYTIQPNDRLGVQLERDEWLLIAILAVLKAGGAYVPLDGQDPAERIAYMLADSGCRQVLNADELTQFRQVQGYYSPVNLDCHAGLDHLSYVMYTSGTTGRSKGVAIAHGALVNYLAWAARTYVRGRALDFALYTSLAFDLTVTSLFTPLLTGNALRIYAAPTPAQTLAQVLADKRVGIVKITPSHLKLLTGPALAHSALVCLIVGGEALESSLAAAVSRGAGPALELYNEYGPTEATVGCMSHRFAPARDTGPSVPVGGPIANTQLYVLSPQLLPVPVGVVGELWIAGAGLAQGYWGQPALTAEKFRPLPQLAVARAYRSGDLARFLPDGNLELLGRVDQQVKLRGYRIELTEIQAVMETYPGVSAGAVQLLPLRPEPPVAANIRYCTKCGLPSNYPDDEFNAAGVCSVCVGFESYKDQAHAYFKPLAELRDLLQGHQQQHTGSYDCLVLLSGGKDSTYVLYQLVREMKLRVLVFTMDNGYISEEAKDNMRRVTQELGVELVFGATEAMNAIFVDSLRQFSNVCNGCFKTIYTLSANLAKQKGIKYIITGLSRGQLYETRLNDLYCANVFDPPTIDKLVLQSRIEYHQKQDAVSENLDVSIFKDPHVFEDIQFIDFYRYADTKLADLYAYLDAHAPWVRPSDTGRSTNCLINDVGIYIHQKERGYHNYALPYAWDVRMGHKEREAALEELHDDLDLPKIHKILAEIGYDELNEQTQREKQLVAYYVADENIASATWRTYLAERLPAYMVPTAFVRLPSLPLTTNGKLNYQALPHPASLRQLPEAGYLAPRNEVEQQLATIWQEVLHREAIGVHDNIFEIGGHSLSMTLIYSRIIRLYGKRLSMTQLFDYPTIAALAEHLSQPALAPVQEELVESRADVRESRRDAVSQQRKSRLQLRATDEDN
jgi:amino acid adenylation domain-containing protein